LEERLAALERQAFEFEASKQTFLEQELERIKDGEQMAEEHMTEALEKVLVPVLDIAAWNDSLIHSLITYHSANLTLMYTLIRPFTFSCTRHQLISTLSILFRLFHASIHPSNIIRSSTHPFISAFRILSIHSPVFPFIYSLSRPFIYSFSH
jgi:hypothetical protein